MGMPTVLTRAGTGASPIWTPDWMQNPFSVGCNIQVSAGTANLEVTYDSLASPTATAGNVTWVVVSTAGANFSAALTGPVQGIRLNIISSTATGVATGTFVQATYPGT